MKILVIGKGTMGNLIFNSLIERYKNDKKTIIDNVSLDKDRIIKKETAWFLGCLLFCKNGGSFAKNSAGFKPAKNCQEEMKKIFHLKKGITK